MIPGVVLVTTALVLSLVAGAKFVAPFVWISAFWALALLVGIKFTSRSNVKALWFNLAVLVIAFGAYETWLYIDQEPPSRYVSLDMAGETQPLSAPDEVLGYAPVKGQSGSWKLYIGDDLVWDMSYSIDSLGLRSAPPDSGSSEIPCVLFFGGSFTLGSGVQDDETTAYQVGIKSGGRFRTYNFGHAGYGPHQMLAALEHGRVDDVIDCQPRYAVYQAVGGHVRRAAGLAPWDTNGPRFLLLPDGSVTQDGTFEPRHSALFTSLQEYLNRSLLYEKLGLFEPRPDDESVRLFVAIVDQARSVFEREYPGSEFHVIFWPNSDWVVPESLERMDALGLSVHLISDVIPDYSAEDVRYRIPMDPHPNALAYSLVADYVIQEILDD